MRTITDPIVESTLDSARGLIQRAAEEAFEAGVAVGSGQVRSTTDVAEELGLSRAFVYKLARKHGLGTKVGRTLMLTPSEVEKLRTRDSQRKR